MFSRGKLGKISSKVKDNALLLEQVFPASREEVYAAFLEPEQLKQWWGPHGWELTFCEVDPQVNGHWHYCMTCIDQSKEYVGQQSWGKAIYEEIEPGVKLVYRDYLSDEQGEINTEVMGSLVTLNFEDQARFTRVKSEARYESKEELDSVLKMGLVTGISETWAKLDQYLKQKNKK